MSFQRSIETRLNFALLVFSLRCFTIYTHRETGSSMVVQMVSKTARWIVHSPFRQKKKRAQDKCDLVIINWKARQTKLVDRTDVIYHKLASYERCRIQVLQSSAQAPQLLSACPCTTLEHDFDLAVMVSSRRSAARKVFDRLRHWTMMAQAATTRYLCKNFSRELH